MLGALYGISLGLRSQVGFPGILFGMNVVTFMPIVYINSYLGADTESYKQGLNFVGVPNAMALCILIWIVIFSDQHEEEENAFVAAAVRKVVDAVAGAEDRADASGSTIADTEGGSDGEDAAAAATAEAPGVEEAEF